MSGQHNDLLGFRCHFYPAFKCSTKALAARCRPAFHSDNSQCPGACQCTKPEAERVRWVNRQR